jgi:hypothetical protein
LGGGGEREEEAMAVAEVIGGGARGGREDGFVVVGILDWEATVREKRQRQRSVGARGTAIASGGGLAPTVKTMAAEVIRGGAKGTAAASGGGLAPAVEVVPMEQN